MFVVAQSESLHWILVVAWGVYSPDQRLNPGPCIASAESYPLGHQGRPNKAEFILPIYQVRRLTLQNQAHQSIIFLLILSASLSLVCLVKLHTASDGLSRDHEALIAPMLTGQSLFPGKCLLSLGSFPTTLHAGVKIPSSMALHTDLALRAQTVGSLLHHVWATELKWTEPYNPEIPLWGIYLNKNTNLRRYPCVCCSIIYDNQNMETI